MAATITRLRHLLRPFISSQRHLQPNTLFSSFSNHHNPTLLSDDPYEKTTGSDIYRHTLKTQRPATIRRQKELENSVSLIGTVKSDVQQYTTSGGILLAHAQLKVESPFKSNRFITILLDMWGDMAELSVQHLKRNDCIYVSGVLRSFTKANDDGKMISKHTVIVKELNFVANNGTKNENIEDQEESSQEKQRKRLYLWQVFFASPYEWRDLRKCKVNPRQPDFKHKSTGESLWLNSHDPPWVTRQLQLQDSRMGDMGLREHLNSRSNLSPLTYNDS